MLPYFLYQYAHQHIAFNSHIYKIGAYHYNWHSETEILVLLTGKVEVRHDGECTILHPGDIIVYSPQCGHATLALEENSIAMVVHINMDFFKAFESHFKTFYFCFSSNENTRHSPFYTLLRKQMATLMLLQLQENEKNNYSMQVESEFLAMTTHLYEKILAEKVVQKGPAFAQETQATFEKMIRFIDEHYHEPIELKDIAAIGGYNPSYASQFFKRQIGISFLEYLKRMRLREAAVLLTNTEDRIVHIANICGFTDVKAFNSAFKEFFNQTPSDYRRAVPPFAANTKLQNWKEFISTNDEKILSILEGWTHPIIENEEKSSSAKLDSDKLEAVKDKLQELLETLS